MKRVLMIALLPFLSNCAASASSDTAPAQAPSPPPAPPPAAPVEAAPATPEVAPATADASSNEAAPAPLDVQHHALVQQQVGFYAVLTPPGYDAPENAKKRYPIIVLLHDGGQDELKVAELSRALGREEAIYVVPRAPYPTSSDTGLGFTASVPYPQDWGGPQSETFPSKDVEALKATELYATQVAEAIKDTRKRYRANWSKVVVFGHGQGGSNAHLFAVHQPWMVKAYVASDGRFEPTTAAKRGISHVAALKNNKVEALLVDTEGNLSEDVKKLGEMFTKNRVEHKLQLVPEASAQAAALAAKRFVRHHCCGEPLEAEAPTPAGKSAAPAPPAAAAKPASAPATPKPAPQPATKPAPSPGAAPPAPKTTGAEPAAHPPSAAAPAAPAAPEGKPVAAAPKTTPEQEAPAPASAPADSAPAKKDVPAKATVPGNKAPAAAAK